MAGKSAFGTTLSRDNGTTFDAISNITNYSRGLSRDTIDVTAHDSANMYREFIGGLIDGGEWTVDLNWDPAATDLGSTPANTTTTLQADFENTDPVAYEMAFPDGSKIAADLLITNFETSHPHDAQHTGSLSFKVSGKPTFTPAP